MPERQSIPLITRITGDENFLGRTVRVYRNLNQNCLSVMDNKTRKVLAHTNSIALVDPVFKVNEQGRRRVLREKRKNVHAFVVGKIATVCPYPYHTTLGVSYNPYENDSFVAEYYRDDIDETLYYPIYRAKFVSITQYGAVAYI